MWPGVRTVSATRPQKEHALATDARRSAPLGPPGVSRRLRQLHRLTSRGRVRCAIPLTLSSSGVGLARNRPVPEHPGQGRSSTFGMRRHRRRAVIRVGSRTRDKPGGTRRIRRGDVTVNRDTSRPWAAPPTVDEPLTVARPVYRWKDVLREALTRHLEGRALVLLGGGGAGAGVEAVEAVRFLPRVLDAQSSCVSVTRFVRRLLCNRSGRQARGIVGQRGAVRGGRDGAAAAKAWATRAAPRMAGRRLALQRARGFRPRLACVLTRWRGRCRVSSASQSNAARCV